MYTSEVIKSVEEYTNVHIDMASPFSLYQQWKEEHFKLDFLEPGLQVQQKASYLLAIRQKVPMHNICAVKVANKLVLIVDGRKRVATIIEHMKKGEDYIRFVHANLPLCTIQVLPKSGYDREQFKQYMKQVRQVWNARMARPL